MSGFCTSAARLGAPDTGLISYGEMVDQVGLGGSREQGVEGQEGTGGAQAGAG